MFKIVAKIVRKPLACHRVLRYAAKPRATILNVEFFQKLAYTTAIFRFAKKSLFQYFQKFQFLKILKI